MFLTTWVLLLAAIIAFVYGIVTGEEYVIVASLIALGFTAFLRRAYGNIRARGDEKGVEVHGTVIPEPDVTPESSPDDEPR